MYYLSAIFFIRTSLCIVLPVGRKSNTGHLQTVAKSRTKDVLCEAMGRKFLLCAGVKTASFKLALFGLRFYLLAAFMPHHDVMYYWLVLCYKTEQGGLHKKTYNKVFVLGFWATTTSKKKKKRVLKWKGQTISCASFPKCTQVTAPLWVENQTGMFDLNFLGTYAS